MKNHPYRSLPDRAFWRRSLADVAPDAVDPVGDFALKIGKASRVATAGSCFAQHIARHLASSGFCYHVAEPGHPMLPEALRKEQGYGLFSARYGNIYTARQLVQLFDRAYGTFTPAEDAWLERPGVVLDPYRPAVQPGGFSSLAEMHDDRRQHLEAVRRMFESLDVFVFTLGLTECWVSAVDGAAFPLCPGVEGGVFDAERHRFVNFGVADVVSDLNRFRLGLKRVNPRAQMILTVSPVPLAATAAEGQHVLTATTYSKSVLRVAAEEMRRAHDDVHYFPSYEIVTGSYNRGRYFAPDLRNVTEEGVSHVMRLFLLHAAGHVAAAAPEQPAAAPPSAEPVVHPGQAWLDAQCDEIALDRPHAA